MQLILTKKIKFPLLPPSLNEETTQINWTKTMEPFGLNVANNLSTYPTHIIHCISQSLLLKKQVRIMAHHVIFL